MIVGKWWLGHEVEILTGLAVALLALVEMAVCVWMLFRRNNAGG